ncbi:hypothetical protein [Mesorhizobium tamadayense]|uniref:hypothetical protein n=1 Tax=Mesorhizobium tamadayense TaxID=425306 RepID=UPI00142D9381|nr:hypothetical protein [Mesorhizobium tamadayense]
MDTIQPLQPVLRIGDHVDLVLEHDLLGQMVEPLRRQPAGMGPGPVLATGKDPAMAQQERQKLLALGSARAQQSQNTAVRG